MKAKILIEVSGGIVSNIVTTGDISIYLVDHDNIKEKGELTYHARQPFVPDRICGDSEFAEVLEEVLQEYTVARL